MKYLAGFLLSLPIVLVLWLYFDTITHVQGPHS